MRVEFVDESKERNSDNRVRENHAEQFIFLMLEERIVRAAQFLHAAMEYLQGIPQLFRLMLYARQSILLWDSECILAMEPLE